MNDETKQTITTLLRSGGIQDKLIAMHLIAPMLGAVEGEYAYFTMPYSEGLYELERYRIVHVAITEDTIHATMSSPNHGEFTHTITVKPESDLSFLKHYDTTLEAAIERHRRYMTDSIYDVRSAHKALEKAVTLLRETIVLMEARKAIDLEAYYDKLREESKRASL